MTDIELCSSCKVRLRGGGLPCYHRTELDMLMFNADSPQMYVWKCPHYKMTNDPSGLIEWIRVVQ